MMEIDYQRLLTSRRGCSDQNLIILDPGDHLNKLFHKRRYMTSKDRSITTDYEFIMDLDLVGLMDN